jgi:hypothetical protein
MVESGAARSSPGMREVQEFAVLLLLLLLLLEGEEPMVPLTAGREVEEDAAVPRGSSNVFRSAANGESRLGVSYVLVETGPKAGWEEKKRIYGPSSGSIRSSSSMSTAGMFW